MSLGLSPEHPEQRVLITVDVSPFPRVPWVFGLLSSRPQQLFYCSAKLCDPSLLWLTFLKAGRHKQGLAPPSRMNCRVEDWREQERGGERESCWGQSSGSPWPVTTERQAASAQRSEGRVLQVAATASRLVFILGRQGREEEGELGEDMGASLAGSADNQSRLGFILGVMCHEQWGQRGTLQVTLGC